MAVSMPTTLTIPKLVKGRGALIKWSAVDGADSYILQRKTSADGSYSKRYSGTNTYFDDQIQTRYTVYGYRVCAVSGETQSDWNTSDDITAISAPNPPGYPVIPDTINVGDTYTVTWTAPSVSEVEGYELQRKVDDGDYITVYKGANLSYTDTAQPTWTKVQYRVAAYRDGDVYSATWSGSDIRTIVGGTSTVPSMPETITVPALTAGQSATITWAGVANAAGYALQRSVGGANYTTVYRGENTSYVDTIGTAWLTVQYRVCAYNSNNNSSDYKTSDVINVVQPVASLLEAIRAHTEQDIKITFADNTVLGKADVAITGDGVKITDILNGDTDYTFGKAVCKQVEMTLFNVDNKFNNFDFTQEFTLQIGVKVGAAFQYVTVGVFKGESSRQAHRLYRL